MRGVFLISLFSNLLNFCVGNLDNDISTIISNLTTGYNRLERPNYGEKPVTVGLTLYILSISELSHTNMDFHLICTSGNFGMILGWHLDKFHL